MNIEWTTSHLTPLIELLESRRWPFEKVEEVGVLVFMDFGLVWWLGGLKFGIGTQVD